MKQQFFKNNQQKLAASFQGTIVLSAYSAMQRGHDAASVFEQEAHFWWLTGIEEPGWWIIIDTDGQKTWLVSPDVSETQRLFDGDLSLAEAKKVSGVNEVISRPEGLKLLRDLAKKHRTVYALDDHPHSDHFEFVINPAQKEVWQMLTGLFADVQDCRAALAKYRAIKQPEEIAMIRDAIQLTIEAFTKIKNTITEYSFEYQIEAEFTHSFRYHSAKGHAYDPIVAAGKNACTLHYGKNQDQLHDGEFVLIDIGARLHGYAADITRTYAYGDVSKRYRAVHGEVQKAHQQIIELLQPGLVVKEYFQQVDDIMIAALRRLNLLKTKDDYRKYFPHSISHGLGIDVHDSLGSPETFLPGMVLTVEPGIYIPEEGIGVRIEDDILITESGYENLSASLSTGL